MELCWWHLAQDKVDVVFGPLICECSLSLCLSVSPSLSVSLLLSDLQCVCLFPLKSFFICVSLFILGP